MITTINNLRRRFASMFKPTMLYGFRRSDGALMKNTRYGSTTLFAGKEQLHIEDHVFINHYCFVDGSNGLRIGEGVQVCCWVSLLTHSSHISIRLYGSRYGGTEMKGYVKGAVEIGDYTFIGPHAIVMPNTRIGKGCIISAYSYVKGDFPDFSIIAGNPALVVGDTRTIDLPHLQAHPELLQHYNAWAK